VVGSLTKHGDEGVDDQSDDQQHLTQRRPEFGLAVPLHCHHVDESVENHDDGYNRSGGNGIAPEMDDNVASGHFKGYQDRFEDEEVPAGLTATVNNLVLSKIDCCCACDDIGIG
jgi:hypothetical protein